MKASKYSTIIEDGEVSIGYNSLTNAMAVLDEKETKTLRNLIEGAPNAAMVADTEQWIRAGHLLDDRVREIDRIKFRMLSARYSTDSLSLTIAPTLACNFRCVYCYEKGIDGESRMSDETTEAVIELVKEHSDHLRILSVVWYGGEPLLGMDRIRDLTKSFKDICSEKNIQYEASIVTNGYLLTEETAKELVEMNVQHAQVTIDGNRAMHDSRRPLTDGSGTYETIFRNIEEASNHIRIALRVNIDKTNVHQLEEIVETIESRGLKEKITVYPGWVESSNGCYSCSTCLSLSDFSGERLKLARTLLEKGFMTGELSHYPNPVANTCGADKVSSFVVSPSGDLYACWSDIGIKENRIGSLVGGDEILPCRRNEYILYDPTEDPECRSCKHLPICMGGCPKRRVDKTAERCTYFKYNLEEYLKFTARRLLKAEADRERPSEKTVRTAQEPSAPASTV